MEDEKTIEQFYTTHFIIGMSVILIVSLLGAGIWLVRDDQFTKSQIVITPPQASASIDTEYAVTWTELENPNFFQSVKQQFLNEKVDFIESDLNKMVLRYYEDGEVLVEKQIISKGREGSWWETPTGLYRVQGREKNHFSSFGEVYMPWSLPFQGNFFIHGWPYYEGGSEVEPGYSGGCIRLATEDAKEIFRHAKVGMPILVIAQDAQEDHFTYAPLAADVSANTYLAADLKNNTVLIEKNSTEQLPIASITKLMTALIAAEHINIEKNLAIRESMLVQTSKPRLQVRERVSVLNLLHLLLKESSNEAAETIAQSRQGFITLMNEKTTSLGMANTTFEDASGSHAGNVSTAQDLFTLAKHLYHNRQFILDVSAGNAQNAAYNAPRYTELSNFNVFAGYEEFVGGKTGKSTTAKETILSIFELEIRGEKRPIAIIVLGSDNSAEDAREILSWIAKVY
jgi:hypothetical protein